MHQNAEAGGLMVQELLGKLIWAFSFCPQTGRSQAFGCRRGILLGFLVCLFCWFSCCSFCVSVFKTYVGRIYAFVDLRTR